MNKTQASNQAVPAIEVSPFAVTVTAGEKRFTVEFRGLRTGDDPATADAIVIKLHMADDIAAYMVDKIAEGVRRVA